MSNSKWFRGTEHWQTRRDRAAIKRNHITMPTREAIARGFIVDEQTVLDYGCGRGDDVYALGNRATGFDPYFAPDQTPLRRKYDVVLLVYVLNIIENPEERKLVLADAFSLCRHGLLLSIYYNSKKAGTSGLTKNQTYQHFYSQPELCRLSTEVLNVTPQSVKRGIIWIPRSD